MRRQCLAIGLTVWLGFLLLFFLPGPARADSPIFQGLLWDTAPAGAYNSKTGEFLVVWNVFNPLYPSTDVRFFGPVMGQLIKENGNKIGDPFEIIASGGVLPQVAYNAQTNEYLVVAERYYNIVGQRVSALGVKFGGMITYPINPGKARVPRVLYNSQAGNYLVAEASWSDTPSCSIQVYTLQTTAYGQPTGVAAKVADEPYDYCADGAIYALAYAPIVTQKTPQGRYLLAIAAPTDLRMLDSQGKLLEVLYDPTHNSWLENLPFQATKVGTPYWVDVAYGNLGGESVFFLVWGDRNQSVPNYGAWEGIWAGIVDAQKELYLTTDLVTNTVFPVSWQYSILILPTYYKEWKPAVSYNAPADKFVVAWRDTPGTDSRDPTTVNHIRVNTVNSSTIPPQLNIIVSSITGTENPTLPCTVSSSQTGTNVVAWEDHRGIFGVGDIYGTLFDAGTRSTSIINPPVPAETPVYWKSVDAGYGHSLGIRSDGSLWAWGNNAVGQLGLGDPLQDQHVPTQVGNWTDWVAVSAGNTFSLGIRSDGSLWAWGYNFFGQLGLGDPLQDQHVPTRVGTQSDWVAVAAGATFSLGIRSDGSLWAWGYNFFGQLGLGDPLQNQHVPTPVGNSKSWMAVSAGDIFSLGIQSDGSLWAWGGDYYGELGLGDPLQNQHVPTPVGNSKSWVAVSAGDICSLGIQSDGSLWAWGWNDFGSIMMIGTWENQHVPTQVGNWKDWVAVSAGDTHGLGIRSDVSLWAWGYNNYGELGLDDTIKEKDVPAQVGNGLDWVAVSAGYEYSLGIRSDGSLWAWGRNQYGQLGVCDTQDRHEPTLVPLSCSGVTKLWLPLILKQ